MSKLLAIFLAALMLIPGSTYKSGSTGALHSLAGVEAKTSDSDLTEVYPDAVFVEVDGDDLILSGETTDEAKYNVFISHDIVYYEDKESYESGNPYGEGEQADRHTAEEAGEHSVLNITAPGTYVISGTLDKGQILVDLGEEAVTDPKAVVTVVLNGVDVTCSVAPAIVFKSAYECDNNRSVETASSDVDTYRAGAILELADGSVNNLNGSHIAKIYKDADGEKKLTKMDGTIESKVSLNIQGGEKGDGTLNLIADKEGIECNLHLTILSGNINIFSQDDGINANEDGVSVLRIDGGKIHILGGLGSEGDGVDSNGWLVINGGTVIAMASPASDAGLDSDMGSFVNGGTVVALGSTMDWAESDSEQVTVNLQFSEFRNSSDAIVITDVSGNLIFAYDPTMDEIASAELRRYQGAVISCPEFKVGATYNLYIGGTVNGTEDMGVYLIDDSTTYSGGQQMGYTGTDVSAFGPGGRPPMGDFNPGERPDDMPEPPEGFDGERPEMPEGGFGGGHGGPGGPGGPGGQRPEMPEGFDGEPPQMPEGGFNPGDGFNPGEGFNPDDENLEVRNDFFMQDKVNAFSGIKAI